MKSLEALEPPMSTPNVTLASAQSIVADLLSDVPVRLDTIRCAILAKALHLVGVLHAKAHNREALVEALRARIAWIQAPGDIGLPIQTREAGEVFTVLCETVSSRIAYATRQNGRGNYCLIPLDEASVSRLEVLTRDEDLFARFSD